MLSNPFKPSPCLRVEVEQSSIFLHPSPNPSLLPSEGSDQLLRGTVTLTLPHPRKLSGLKVVFDGIMSYNGGVGFPYEEEQVLLKELEIDLKNEVLPAGESTYEFTFIVPSNSPEFQRFYAIAKTSGTWNSGLKSAVAPVYPLGNPAAPGELPGEYTDVLPMYSEELGPVAIAISAPHLTVSSLLNFEISLASPPAGLALKKLKAFVEQTFEITYPDGRIARPPPVRHRLFEVDETTTKAPAPPSNRKDGKAYYSPPASPSGKELGLDGSEGGNDGLPPVRVGEEWVVKKLARLPNDDKIRPTTLEGLRSRVRVTHSVGVEIQHESDGGQRRATTISKKIHIVSCCAMRDLLRLPAYSKDPSLVRAKKPADCDCVCCSSFAELVELDKKEILGPITPSEAGFVLAADPLSKTPAVGAERGGYGLVVNGRREWA
ncbi:Arrestin-like, N-terminal and Immunoglobulin E-set domain protein [Pseudohyphozyma bogoriensis]|nr:Arrestin-like, N-terminal and Immunoglobulin E-set domain protein [Pseudohyphozyma bogoriensis]